MAAAVINVCVDPRLRHDAIRAQVQQWLDGARLKADRIFITSDAAGNVGSGLRNTIDLLVKTRDPIVLAAVLHHDDCIAGQQGMRQGMDVSRQALSNYLRERGVRAPVLTGQLRSEDSLLTWDGAKPPQLETTPFRMPRMYGS